MVAYVVWDINFKSDVRSDLQGCLEAIVASKPSFLCLYLIDGSSTSSNNELISQKIQINLNLLKTKFSIFHHVSRNAIRPDLNFFCHRVNN